MLDTFHVSHILLLFHLTKDSWNKSTKYQKTWEIWVILHKWQRQYPLSFSNLISSLGKLQLMRTLKNILNIPLHDYPVWLCWHHLKFPVHRCRFHSLLHCLAPLHHLTSSHVVRKNHRCHLQFQRRPFRHHPQPKMIWTIFLYVMVCWWKTLCHWFGVNHDEFMFVDHLAAPRPTLGHFLGDTFHPMLATLWLFIKCQGHQEPLTLRITRWG